MLEFLLAMSGGSNAAWSTSDKSAGMTLSNENLTALTTLNKDGIRGDTPAATKQYFEVRVNGAADMVVGVAALAWPFSTLMGRENAKSCGVFNSGSIYTGGGTLVAGSFYTNTDRISVAVDAAQRRIFFAKNGVWMNSANPETGAGWISYVTTDLVYPAFQGTSATTINITANFVGPFVYPLPVGYGPWG